MIILIQTYSGANKSITGVGFRPDWCWFKQRNATAHALFDIVRGTTKFLESNGGGAQQTQATSLTFLTQMDYTLGTDASGHVGGSSTSVVCWNWRAGNAQGSSNTDGTINTTYTSVNTTAGFSISQYTGNGSNSTFGHGLGAVPKLVMVKDIGTSVDWLVYHSALGATKNLRLNTNEQVDTSGSIWYNTAPTSSVVSIGTSSAVNGNGNNYIAYCFTEKKDFQNLDPTKEIIMLMVHLFTLVLNQLLLCVRFTGSGVMIGLCYDNKRPNSANPTPNILEANTTDAENTDANFIRSFKSNGFKFRGTELNVNGAQNYLYWAFAEEPISIIK